MIESLSIQQARKLILLSQKLPYVKQQGSAIFSTLSALEHLGYIQIDTISVIQRAHHHTLWNRNPRYDYSHLDQLLNDKRIFEYWSHAAAYLPMKDFRYSLVRKKAIACGNQNHWYERKPHLMKLVMERIKAEGPLMAKDFAQPAQKSGIWEQTPIKQALECLFMQGDLMVPYRNHFHKVYDLTERVLPEGIDTTLPNQEEYGRFLVIAFLQANGIGHESEFGYLLKNTQKLIVTILREMRLSGELLKLNVAGKAYYALPVSLELLSNPLARSKLKFLSPFDNLLIQRTRIQSLFGFKYQLECYLPKVKRRYGYFSLPVLWDGKLVARMDCKAERKKSLFHIYHLALEPGLAKTDDFGVALGKELTSFIRFNACEKVQLHRTSPDAFRMKIFAMIGDMTGREENTNGV